MKTLMTLSSERANSVKPLMTSLMPSKLKHHLQVSRCSEEHPGPVEMPRDQRLQLTGSVFSIVNLFNRTEKCHKQIICRPISHLLT